MSLIRHSSVPHQFWDEAVCTTVYLINRLPTSILQNRSPYHLVYNQEPTYSLLKSFGCTCYPCLRSYATSKLDSRSEKWVFLGYNALHLGYRCLSLTSGKLYINFDVIFQEHDYPYKLSSLISNSNTSLTLRLLGPSPAPILPTCTFESISPSPDTPLSSSASLISPVSSISPSLKLPGLSNQDSSLSLDDSLNHTNPFEVSITGHTPSTNPLSTSNVDSHTSPSRVKTRGLYDILCTIDLVIVPHSPKYPLPVCLHTSAPLPHEPTTFISASKHREWIATMHDEFNALLQNQI